MELALEGSFEASASLQFKEMKVKAPSCSHPPEHRLAHVVCVALQLSVDICPLLLLDELRNVVDSLPAGISIT